MRKTSKSKIRLAIIATLACTAIVTVQYLVLKPSVINQIQINRVYIGGLFTEYPTKYQQTEALMVIDVNSKKKTNMYLYMTIAEERMKIIMKMVMGENHI